MTTPFVKVGSHIQRDHFARFGWMYNGREPRRGAPGWSSCPPIRIGEWAHDFCRRLARAYKTTGSNFVVRPVLHGAGQDVYS